MAVRRWNLHLPVSPYVRLSWRSVGPGDAMRWDAMGCDVLANMRRHGLPKPLKKEKLPTGRNQETKENASSAKLLLLVEASLAKYRVMREVLLEQAMILMPTGCPLFSYHLSTSQLLQIRTTASSHSIGSTWRACIHHPPPYIIRHQGSV